MVKKVLTPLLAFGIPLCAFCADIQTKRTFFPGRSWYFWLFIATGFYIFFIYKTSKNKKGFFKTPFILGITVTCAILFSTFMFSNLFINDTRITTREKVSNKQVYKLMETDEALYKLAENNFTDPEVHDNYINNHFSIPMYWKDKNDKLIRRDDFTIQNFYYDKLTFTDSNYIKMGYYGLGIFFYFTNNYWNAKQFISKADPNTKFLDYYKSQIFLSLTDTSQAILYLKKATEHQDKYLPTVYTQLISLLYHQHKVEELSLYLNSKHTRQYVPFDIAMELYLKNGRLFSYYLLIITHTIESFKFTGLIAALVILCVWLAYIIRIDIFEHERILPILFTLISGMLSVFLVFLFGDFTKFILGINSERLFLNDLLFYIVKVGLIEESVKILPLLLMLLFYPKVISEAYDYILYASISALGFAFVENLMYFQQDLTNIIYVRALTSVPGHMIDSSIVAYGFVLSRYRFKDFPVYISFPVFLLFGAVIHGLYDFWAFTNTLSLFVFHLLFSVSIWVIIINNCINNSPFFSYRLKLRSDNLQVFMAVCLTIILALQYFLISFEMGPSVANNSLNSTLFIGGLFIVYYTDKLTNMDLVKGYWYSINLKTIGELRRNSKFSIKQFLIRLISGDIVPHTFVGNRITLESHEENSALFNILPDKLDGFISDRLVVNCISKANNKMYKDPYWFMLQTERPIIFKNFSTSVFLFRFLLDDPSFKKNNNLSIYLFCTKEGNLSHRKSISRNDLRSLGKAIITKKK